MAKTRKRKAATAQAPKNALETGEVPPPKAKDAPSDRFKGFSIKGFQQASDVFDRVTSVRTCFPGYNLATRTGGHPVRRITTVHGPTHGGKTVFVLGLLKSFIDAGHVGGYIDAEHATPLDFIEELMNELAAAPNFLGQRPRTYEETINGVDNFLNEMVQQVNGDPKLCSMLLVDSINKLVPERELKAALSKGAEELAKGHMGRGRAQLNQAWLDHVVPQLGPANCSMTLIAQERDDQEEAGKTKGKGKFAKAKSFKVKGGGALLYDASIVARVFKSSPNYEKPSDTSSPIVGFKHRVRIWKSKVGHMDGRYTDCFFNFSNGRFAPAGLDTARDLVDVGIELGLISVSGSWYTLPVGKKRGVRKQGANQSVAFLNKEPEAMAQLWEKVNAATDARREVEA